MVVLMEHQSGFDLAGAKVVSMAELKELESDNWTADLMDC